MGNQSRSPPYTQVYCLVKEIPPGQVATYGQIACLLGNPRMAKVVGGALNACRDTGVPCHRVVNRTGGLAGAFSPFGKETHRLLLEMEEVPFLPDGRVDLEKCRWPGPESPQPQKK